MVFGAGQVGRALAARLAGMGLPVRAVSRSGPSEPVDGAEWPTADTSDPTAAVDAAQVASVVYQCLNAPYTVARSVSRHCTTCPGRAEHNAALLVSLENLHDYGPRPRTWR